MNPFKTAARIFNGKPEVAYTHVERALADETGLTHETVKDARGAHLQRGPDWELVKGLVTYSDAGRAKIYGALGVPVPVGPAATGPESDPAPLPADSPPNTDPAAAADEKIAESPPVHGELRDLAFVRRVSNRRTLLARTAGGVAAWVRVSDSTNFRPGMTLPCRFLERDQWELARKAPRHPGKW